MKRKIITINEELCNGCELCVKACHEGAIGMVNGKARLLRDDYCDGLGDCLPSCPTGAISFEEREALPYNEEEVKRNMEAKKTEAKTCETKAPNLPCGCPGSMARSLQRTEQPALVSRPAEVQNVSRLQNFPVQLKLVPVNAPYFHKANLLVAADCAAYAHGDFHESFMKDRITLIGCPKLDSGEYSEKICDILKANDVESITVVRMEVPCCGGIEAAVKQAVLACGKFVQCRIVTLGIDGDVR